MTSLHRDNRKLKTPNAELLRAQGWHISSTVGPYCTAWRNCQEVLFIWKDGTWQRTDNPPARR